LTFSLFHFERGGNPFKFPNWTQKWSPKEEEKKIGGLLRTEREDRERE